MELVLALGAEKRQPLKQVAFWAFLTTSIDFFETKECVMRKTIATPSALGQHRRAFIIRAVDGQRVTHQVAKRVANDFNREFKPSAIHPSLVRRVVSNGENQRQTRSGKAAHHRHVNNGSRVRHRRQRSQTCRA